VGSRFLKGDIGLCNGLFAANAFFHGFWFTTKNLARPSWCWARQPGGGDVGRAGCRNTRLLGEIVDAVETLRAFLRTAEIDAILDVHGDFVPNPDTMSTARTFFPRVYPRLIEILQLVGSSGLMATPTERDLAAPEIAADVERYFQSATLMGHDRVRLSAGLGSCLQLVRRAPGALRALLRRRPQRADGGSIQQLRPDGRGGAREGAPRAVSLSARSWNYGMTQHR
jgi:hypothetical protein